MKNMQNLNYEFSAKLMQVGILKLLLEVEV